MKNTQLDRPTPETDAFIVQNTTNEGPTGVKWRAHAERLERERDEAWACCDELVVDSNAITLAKTVMRLERERDEAREVLREIAEASGFDNIGNWARNKARKEIDRYREKNDLLPISWDV